MDTQTNRKSFYVVYSTIGVMKTNSSMNVTCTLNADDLLELYENGELKDNGVVIGTTQPELERFKSLVDGKS